MRPQPPVRRGAGPSKSSTTASTARRGGAVATATIAGTLPWRREQAVSTSTSTSTRAFQSTPPAPHSFPALHSLFSTTTTTSRRLSVVSAVSGNGGVGSRYVASFLRSKANTRKNEKRVASSRSANESLPSLADAFYLIFYLFCYLKSQRHQREPRRRRRATPASASCDECGVELRVFVAVVVVVDELAALVDSARGRCGNTL